MCHAHPNIVRDAGTSDFDKAFFGLAGGRYNHMTHGAINLAREVRTHEDASIGVSDRQGLVLGVIIALVFVADAHALETTATKHQSWQSVRAELVLASGWQFSLDETNSPGDIIEPEFDDANWQAVAIPHTWNAKHEQSIQNTYKRGVGYDRLKFELPRNLAGSRFWIQFNAVSLVSAVWLNGQFIGEHKGGFAMFRYDVTGALRRNGANLLVVKADNTTQSPGTATEDVIAFSGDFNVLGGIYRHVLLLSTNATLVDTLDQGSSGICARSTDVSSARATINVDARVRTFEGGGRAVIARVSLLDRKGRVVASRSSRVSINAGPEPTRVEQTLEIGEPHLWQGVADPYLSSWRSNCYRRKVRCSTVFRFRMAFAALGSIQTTGSS